VSAGSFEESPDLNCEHFVKDGAFHVTCAGQVHLARTNYPVYPTTDRAFLCYDLAFEIGALSDRYRAGADIAIDLAIDLYVARGRESSIDNQIIRDDGWRSPTDAFLLLGQRHVARRRWIAFATPCKHFAPHRKTGLDFLRRH
jgi:hypothetical protein